MCQLMIPAVLTGLLTAVTVCNCYLKKTKCVNNGLSEGKTITKQAAYQCDEDKLHGNPTHGADGYSVHTAGQ